MGSINRIEVVNLPNLLTFSRVPILFLITGLLYMQFPWASTAAFIFFIIGALTDWADGYLARKLGLVSNFGKLMDALTDKIFVLGLFLVLLVRDVLPAWALPFLLIMLSREFIVTGLRLVAASNGTVLAAEKSGKQKTVLQILCLALLLLAEALAADFQFIPYDAVNGLVAVGKFCFVLAAALTLSSGIQYLVKYWKLFTGESHSSGSDPS